MTTETLTVTDAVTTLDLLIFRRYRREVHGLVEQTLDRNPGLAALGLILPVGTKVAVEIPTPATKPVTPIRLFS